MARIWRVYEGREPTTGGPWAEMPLADAIRWLDLEPGHFVSDLEETPRFGPQDGDHWYRGYKVVVVEVDQEDIKSSNWRIGFYKSPLSPIEALGRLQRRAVERTILQELGTDKVVRVAWTPAIDSQNEEAIRITIILKPDIAKELGGRATLDVLAKIREQFDDAGDTRTPLVEYATEAELAGAHGH